ncbi:MAG: TolB family protein, partial [Wenzhouxiangella sp.]
MMVSRTAMRALVVAALILVPLAAAGEGMTLEQIARLKQVSEAEISPDGRWIAYTRVVPRDLAEEDDGPAWRELHVVDRDGDSRAFVAGQVSIHAIGWMPDSSAVTFLDEREDDEHATLYRIPVDGGEARRVTTVGEGVSDYSISPDGSRVALIATEKDDESLERRREKGFDQVVFEEEWKPRRLWIGEIDGGSPEAIDIEGSVQEVRWSPAGDRLGITVTPRQLIDDTLMFKRLRIVSADGETIGEVETPGKLGQWNWSPDGNRIA